MDSDYDISKLTPLFQQYFGLKQSCPGCLVLMQCGDFYEAYGDDAETFARDLELVLTSKDAGEGRRLAMAGIPIHAIEPYLRMLVSKGHRVAVAEQMMNPADCKGLVPREVTRIVTAGTILDLQSLDEKNHNYLVCLTPAGNGRIGFAAADISTGDFCGTELEGSAEAAGEEILRFAPSELIAAFPPRRSASASQKNDRESSSDDGFDIEQLIAVMQAQLKDLSVVRLGFKDSADICRESLKREFKLAGLAGLGLEEYPGCIQAMACLLGYIKGLAFKHPIILETPRLLGNRGGLTIDLTTRRNLELVETLLGRERRGSLLGAIDLTCTSMGARKLKEWMLRPLMDIKAIRARHERCAALVENGGVRRSLRDLLKTIVDIERLLARISYGSCSPRELLGISASLGRIPETAALLEELGCAGFSGILEELKADLNDFAELGGLLEKAVSPDAPLALRDGGIIRSGYSAELDELRNIHQESRQWLSRLEEREREATGIKNLKVGYTSVFGYYLEVTKANSKLVPINYTRKQTLVNSERYIIPELKEHEVKVLGAQDRIKKIEYDLFQELRRTTVSYTPALRRLARNIAELDVYCSFAQTAASCQWTRPEMNEDFCLEIVKGRHPVVEQTLGGFVPNDCYLDSTKPLIILTGPNMSGKSTWLRQIAQIAVLAQMGSFVPAETARLPVFDRIFTRVGASDDLHLGQSTFMVEMNETANIVNNATSHSLVVLDEIGRGTSTFDGLALAQAVVEYLHDGPHPLTLFATHFHELTRLGRTLRGCRNFRVAVKEIPGEVVFLHKIVPGGADRSYGIYVAKLAGMPEALLQRAENLLRRMEQESRRRGGPAGKQLDMLDFDGDGGCAGAGQAE